MMEHVNQLGDNNFVGHIDVYQGKYAKNVGVSNEAATLPTTQKAVINAFLMEGISKDPDGCHVIHTDNRYASSKLAVRLRTQHNVLINGTTHTNQKGLDGNWLNMKTSAPHGSIICKYDKNNKVLYIQWNFFQSGVTFVHHW